MLPGFGSGGPSSSSRSNSESVPASTGSTKVTSKATDDPFVVLESASTPVTSPPSVFIDPLETIHKMNKSGSTNAGVSRGVFDFDDIDPFMDLVSLHLHSQLRQITRQKIRALLKKD